MINNTTRKKALARLRRTSAQVGGIARRVEEDRHCPDLLRQLATARAALGQSGNLAARVSDAMAAGMVQVLSRDGRMGRRAED